MTKQRRRDYLLRYLDQARNDIVRAVDRLGLMMDFYTEDYQDHFDFLYSMSMILNEINEALQRFRDEKM